MSGYQSNLKEETIMQKVLVVAEKPSLLREIVKMLEAKKSIKFQNNRDYYESDEYLLSSFFGHLLELYLPNDYGFNEWKSEDLPIIPQPFKFKYKNEAKQRGELLAKLAEKCSSIINACDPDREGEGIFRTWYKYEGINKPVKRLWANSLAMNDLHKSFDNLILSEKYDNLAAAQSLRQEADWLIGMNGSRAYSIASNSKLSIGRVQTATLNLIVRRDNEVENYKESYFYTLTGNWYSIPFTYFNDTGTKFEVDNHLKKVKIESEETPFHLKDFVEKNKVQNPPLPFSLHDLQKVANDKFSYSLDKTLTLAQSLYEKKLLTYPRTDSPYLPPADLDSYYSIISTFSDSNLSDLLIKKGDSVACLKNTDSAHTAIIPTGQTPVSLSDDELNIFNLVVKRFITAFLKPRTYIQYSIVISNDKYEFRSKVNKTIDPGFSKIKSDDNKSDDDSEDESDKKEIEITVALSKEVLAKANKIQNFEIVRSMRTKPQYYTPGTLVIAMMKIGRNIDNKELKDILSEVHGIGTEATRDKFPLELEKRGYIEKCGKYLKSTLKGKQLISWVKPEIKSPELTAEWEMKLKKIEKGQYDISFFRSEIIEFTKLVVNIDNSLKDKFVQAMEDSKRKCPKCSKSLSENSAGFFCDAECGFALYKTLSGKTLSTKDIDQLFSTGRTSIMSGFKKKDASSTYSACLYIDNSDYKVKMSFDSTTDYDCPFCKNKMKAYSSNVKCECCNFTVWLVVCEKRITDSQIKSLLTKGRTSVIKGFKSNKNRSFFDASLVVDKINKKVSFEFQNNSGSK